MANPVCPTDCSTALPSVLFDVCAPEINLSEIQYIYIGHGNAAPFTLITDPTEWAGRLSQTATGDKIRTLTVVADKPAPAKAEKDISLGRKVVLNKTHTLNVTIDETGTLNHDFVRNLECGGKYRIWYETQGGLLYGGAAGIYADVFLDVILARGREEHGTIAGQITWRSKFTEERVVSPIAH